ncbi:hypothetical protein [Bosea sp. ANAM02]|uniref:hypothetical protein n=1 Tax=Bosea sp. ANAM02 TaxID=2020412 RepID=UPI00140F4113|nr:hypothetical protein [Bosea sp. ANAM02]BCB18966.1 hypothetical protein OCUBac02_18600 [Bosea sp. ANAM02]
MRKTMIAIGAALLVSGGAMAQAPATPAPTQSTPSDEKAATIKSISVVDMDALPAAAQERVTQQSKAQPAGQLQRVQSAIEGEPKLKSALATRGFTARDVVLASLDSDGELTIVAKRAS